MQKLGFARLLGLVGLLALVMLLHAAPVAAQEAVGPTDPAELEAFIDGIMAAQLADKHIAGATISVVRDGELLFAKGYGYADVERRDPVDPETTLFRIGSISKLFTWTAVMQLFEQGKLDLDEDINTYLDFKIPDTYPGQPITLTHLLTHTPGFEDRGIGMAAATPEEIAPLGAWLADHIPARVRPPGAYSAYSNYGVALAGYIIERVSGLSYDEYIEQHILEPLGMEYATTRQTLSAQLAPHMSEGYRHINGAFEVQDFELYNIAPAGSISASATEMAKFMIAHLQDGQYGEVRILEEATAQQMHSQLFTHDERLNGWAYGFYEMNQNDQWIIGHGGDTQWFHSLLALLPEHNVGVFVSTNSEGGSMVPQALVEAFVDRYYPEPDPASPQPPADFAERASRFAGSYRMNRTSYTTPEKIINLFMPISVRPADDGTLLVNTPFGKMRFVEVEPLVFQEVGGDDRVIFREDEQGHITHAFLDSEPIVAIEKLKWYEAPAFHYVLLAVILVLYLSFLIAAPATFFVNRRLGDAAPPTPPPSRMARRVLVAVVILCILFVVVLAMAASDNTALLTGHAPLLNVLPAIALLMVTLTLGAAVFAVLAWVKGYWRLSGRIHYTLVMLSALAFHWVLIYWNMLGSRI